NSISVEAHGNALLEIDRDFAFALGARPRIEGQHEEIFRWRLRWIFQNSTFVTHVPDIAVAAINLFCGRGDWNVPFLGVCDRVMSRLNVPFTPWSNDLELGSECFVGQLEADLIVAFSSATMRDCVGTFRQRYLNLPLRQQWACNRRTKQVLAFIHRPGLDERPKIFRYEFVAQIFHIALRCAGSNCLFFQTLKLIILAYIAGHRDDFAAVVFLQPRDDD